MVRTLRHRLKWMNRASRHPLTTMAGASCRLLKAMDRSAVTRSVYPQFHQGIRLVSDLIEAPRLQVSAARWGSCEQPLRVVPAHRCPGHGDWCAGRCVTRFQKGVAKCLTTHQGAGARRTRAATAKIITQPRPNHMPAMSAGICQISLPQIAAQAEEARGEQQAQGAGDVHADQSKRMQPTGRVGSGYHAVGRSRTAAVRPGHST